MSKCWLRPLNIPITQDMTIKKYDRQRQRQILTTAINTYPDWVDCANGINDQAAIDVIHEIRYLEELGLLQVRAPRYLELLSHQVSIKATAKGIDFMQDDGGLSAVLDVVTVRLDDDTIKGLIASRIQKSDLSQTEKRKYLDTLRELPADATKHAAQKLVEMGLENSPKAIPWIGTLLGIL